MEILEPGKDYSKLKVFDEIRQKKRHHSFNKQSDYILYRRKKHKKDCLRFEMQNLS